MNLPDRDSRGHRVPQKKPLRIAVLPACASCSVQKLSANWHRNVAQRADVVVVFDEESLARKSYPGLASCEGMAVFYAPHPKGIPPQLESLAPGIAVLEGDHVARREEL